MDSLGSNKKNSFNIISSNTNHGGFGANQVELNAVASVIIEDEKAYIDMGALHAKSAIEKGIKFSTNKEDVPNGKKAWIVWVASDRNANGPCYVGITACEMLVDREARRGYKILADHVNKMDYAMKRRIMLDGLNPTEASALRQLLIENNPKMWENTSEQVKQAFDAFL